MKYKVGFLFTDQSYNSKKLLKTFSFILLFFFFYQWMEKTTWQRCHLVVVITDFCVYFFRYIFSPGYDLRVCRVFLYKFSKTAYTHHQVAAAQSIKAWRYNISNPLATVHISDSDFGLICFEYFRNWWFSCKMGQETSSVLWEGLRQKTLVKACSYL